MFICAAKHNALSLYKKLASIKLPFLTHLAHSTRRSIFFKLVSLPVTLDPPISCCWILCLLSVSPQPSNKHHTVHPSQFSRFFILNCPPSFFKSRVPSLLKSSSQHPTVVCTQTYHTPPFMYAHVRAPQQDCTLYEERGSAAASSQLSNTPLLYSEIFDKYLTWLKGQTWSEERAKRDFSIHTQNPVTSPPLLSRMYFWPQAAKTNSPRSHSLWTR